MATSNKLNIKAMQLILAMITKCFKNDIRMFRISVWIIEFISLDLFRNMCVLILFNYYVVNLIIIIIILAQTPEIGQGLGRFLSCGARKPEQTWMDL